VTHPNDKLRNGSSRGANLANSPRMET